MAEARREWDSAKFRFQTDSGLLQALAWADDESSFASGQLDELVGMLRRAKVMWRG